ncbi:MAG: 4Fe-4S dicluster domain-containing protein [Polyangiales bacterium]
MLLGPTSSPTVVALIERVRERLPRARFFFDAPLARASAWEGARLAFGRVLEAQYDFIEADVVLALDADPLASGPFALRYARQLASRRRGARMSRVYAAECAPSLTGSLADHRLRARRGEVVEVARAVLAQLAPSVAMERGHDDLSRWAEVVARDLRAHAGRAVVVAGDGQPAAVHAAAHAINASVASARTTWLTAPAVFEAGVAGQGIADLARELRAGRVEALLVLGGNPVYTAPAELDFAAAMRRAPTRLRLGLYEDETAAECGWFVPEAHALESWGDARARDGTVSLVQPLIDPLYGGRTVIDVLAALAGVDGGGATLVRAQWGARWDAALRGGVVAGTAFTRVDAEVDQGAVSAALAATRHDARGVEVGFVADAKVYDGRFANNAWLQEFPDPITRLAWENAALLSPATAARLGLTTGDLVEVSLRGRRVRGPAFVLPGHADEAVTLPLGYGRRGAEALARGVGFDAYPLRTSDAMAFAAGGAIRKLGPRRALATTQSHWSLEGRPILRGEDPPRRALPTLYPERPVPAAEVQWGMAVDLSACVGCGACVVACQAENNIPVVGREGVLQSREMHWLRVDRYFVGDARDPRVAFEPMLCQHCEKAPCEYVCPVNATTHSPDGINEQTYNRCVGTRFCSNNCPYKVRRFNWLDYRREQPEVVSLAMNPEVTVRQRGVMEKCTYCLQRVRRAQRDARVEGRPIRDGDVTACQQTCPAGAITFGPVSDPGSAVSRLHRDARAFRVLESLGTEPRTRYLARVTNPNPALEGT